jgi:hypothetical protein
MWWAFLGEKLSGLWPVSWWVITIPLDVLGLMYAVFLALFALIGVAASVAAAKGGKNDIDNAFQRIRSR